MQIASPAAQWDYSQLRHNLSSSNAVVSPLETVADCVTFSGRKNNGQRKPKGSTVALDVWMPQNRQVIPPGLALQKNPASYKEDIVELWKDCFTDGSPEAAARVREDLETFIRRKFKFCIFTNGQNGVVAVGVMNPEANDYAEIFDVAVSPEAQGRGIGKAVMQYLLNQAKMYRNPNKPHHRVSAVKLQVDANNQPALNLYKRLGFEERRAGRTSHQVLDLARWEG